MIKKQELENIIRKDLMKVINTEIIYQYSEFSIALEKILLEQTLNFSDPEVFNDPFDCNEKLLEIEYNENDIDRIINASELTPTRQERRILKEKLKNKSYQKELIKPLKKDYKISCFSESYEEILLWSHYGNKHSGICIGFDFPHHYEDKFIICPVKYTNRLKTIDGETNALRIIMYWLTTKSIRWDYEKEIRAITKAKTKEKYEIIEIDSSTIKEVIFGCNVSEEKTSEAVGKLRNSNLNFDDLLIKKMIIDEETFLLKEKIIKPRA